MRNWKCPKPGRSLPALLVLAFVLAGSIFPALAQGGATVPAALAARLTEQERQFLAKTGTLRAQNEKDWAPFNFHENGAAKGFSIDYMKLLAKKIGVDVQFVNGPTWDEFLALTRKGELDVMLNIAKSPEREKFLEFAPSYVTMSRVLYTRKDFPAVSSIKDMYGKRIAVPKGFFFQAVLKAYPQITVVEVADTTTAIRAVSTGMADAIFDLMPVVDYITRQLQITNLKVGGDLGIKESEPVALHLAVRKDIKILAGILEKGMKTITDEELRALQEKWLGNSVKLTQTAGPAKELVLTDEERAFLKGKAIRLGIDTVRPPFEYIDDKGVYSGISAEFIIAAAKRLGVEIVPLKDMKWTEAMQKIADGEVDVIPKVTPSAAREKVMTFTKPYTSFPSVIVSRKDLLAGGLDDLRGLKIGVVKGQIIEANLKRDYPEFTLVPCTDVATGLRDLSTGKFDAFVDNLGAVAHSMEAQGLANLRVAASTPYNHDLAFGVRKDWPLLVSALDKALDSMTDKEKQEIRNKWLAIKFYQSIDWRIWGPVLGAIVVIMVVILIWNRKLAVAMRQRQEAMLAAQASEAEVTRKAEELGKAYAIIADSITYASRIQKAVLPEPEALAARLPQHMALWRPRDVVGGDIYWARPWGDGLLVILGDCTGHGVPGAFMTLIATGALDMALRRTPPGDPAALLTQMHQLVQKQLGQDCGNNGSGNTCSDDGLEAGACFVPADKSSVTFSGARFSLFVQDGPEVSVVKGTGASMGYRNIPVEPGFSNRTIPAAPKRRFFLSSDGLLDQVGGESGRAFGKKRFQALLAEHAGLPLSALGEVLFARVEAYRGGEIRLDDIAVMGFEL